MEASTPVIIERTYSASVNKVWQAITDKEQIKQWYFDIAQFEPNPGFEFSFTGGTEEHSYLHLCKITEVIPYKKLAYSWRYDGYEGNSLVIFELVDEGGKTRLKLTHEGLETFPAHNPDFAKENVVKGWSYIVCTSLPSFVENETLASI
jgi:uncharacterized protein YndB with AHSA1/START domain